MTGGIYIKSLPKAENGIYFNYFTNIKPELDRQFKLETTQLGACLPEALLKQTHPELSSYFKDLKCAGILTLQPGIDIKNTLGFMVAFQMICFCLDYLCESWTLNDEALVNQLYQPLYDTIDIGRIPGRYDEYFSNKKLGAYITSHVDTCRRWVAILPSYSLVAGKIKRYIQMYISLQSYKYQPLKLRREILFNWCNYYIRQYPDISFQEFSASADSLFGIYSMLMSASNHGITEKAVKELDSAYIPWICSYHKLLSHFVTAREDVMIGRLNYTDFYDNLKQCENRLIFLFSKSSEYCAGVRNPEYHSALVKLMPAIYLSDTRSQFGLNRLASRNILTSAPYEATILHNCCKLLRLGK